MLYRKYVKIIQNGFNTMDKMPIDFFKFGTSLILMALSGIYFLCEEDVSIGSVGIELYYAPMLDYILTTFIIFWAGMFIIDITQRESTAGKMHRR